VSGYTGLVSINLKGNDIHDEGASHVAKMFYFMERLHLDISENPIGISGTSYVFQAVRETTVLKTLILIGSAIIADLLPVEKTVSGQRATTGRGVLWVLDDYKPHLHSMFLSPNSSIECFVIVTSLHIIDKIIKDKSKPLLVSLLRCLHEAQDPALCLYVAERLEYRLDLSETSLSPLDCLSVSFFLSSIAGEEVSAKVITVNLSQCQIGDLGAKCLTKYLSMSGCTDLVTINLKGNDIHDEGASHVAKTLYFIERLHLNLSENPIGVTGTSYMFQAVKETTILKTLILIGGTIIADLLPVKNAQETATGLRTTNGRGILWILDDLQPHLHSVIFSSKHSSNTEYFIIVTSRHTIGEIIKDKSKPLLVYLLRCLHEAQDPALCLYVAKRLVYRLDLSGTSLSPLDCCSVSFFLSFLTGKVISIDLHKCNIDDFGATCLSRYLYADKNLDYVSKVTIDLAGNEIHEEGTLHIAWMLYFIEHLYLSHNPIGDTGVSVISEAVRETATLKTLILYNCGITSRGAEDLSRALAQNSSLEKLDIGWNSVGDEGISHVAEALKQNKQLKELWIGGSAGMTDKGAASLASVLTVNNSLKLLHIGGDKRALTEDGLLTIAQSLAKHPKFVKLAIPAIFVSTSHLNLEVYINASRNRNGLPPIEVKGECTVQYRGVI
jgi:Ran GTPase-activating protein (RanGAP) involved in mRNA processing and transport